MSLRLQPPEMIGLVEAVYLVLVVEHQDEQEDGVEDAKVIDVLPHLLKFKEVHANRFD